MCRLLTPNLGLVHKATQSDESQSHVTERRGNSGSNRMLRKKLSFSNVLKCKSGNSSRQDVESSISNPHSTIKDSIPHSTERVPSQTDVQHLGAITSHSHSTFENPRSPLVIALGLVRQVDLPLTWLDPTSVYSCNGLYIPRETRNSLCFLSENKSSRLFHGNFAKNKATDHLNTSNLSSTASSDANQLSSSVMAIKNSETQGENSSRTKPPLTPTSSPFHRLNLTPTLRLDRYPLSSLNSRHFTSTNRLRRTKSVPKDIHVACSTSVDLPSGRDEVVRIKSGAKKLRKIKSSRSLPSSPVVLCSKLPLLKLQDCLRCTHKGGSPLSTSRQGPLSVLLSPTLLQLKLGQVEEARVAQKGEGEGDGDAVS